MAREMKDSGVEWIGEIPANWQTDNIRRVFSFGKGLPITKEDLRETGLPVISYGQIHSKNNNGVTVKPELLRYVDTKYCKTNPESLVRNGDFVFADTSEDLEGCGNCVYIDTEDLIFAGYHTIILRNKAANDNRYFAFLFQSDIWRKQIRGRVSGVKVFSISQKILRDASLLIPTREEQGRIADYLTDKCNQIDSVIEQTRASIEEYKRMKQAVITRAVTKGIRPGRKMKDSGIEWIGEIPDEWETSTISNNIGFEGGSQPPLTSFVHEQKEGYVRLIQNRDYKTGAYLTYVPVTSALKYCDEDDVMIGRYGPPTFVMHRGLKGAYNVALMKAIPKGIDREWMAFVLQEYTLLRYVESFSKRAAGQDGVNPIILKKYPLPLPSIEEQKEIACYLQKQMKEYDRLIDLKESLISDLESYKKSLVYEYVTGKKEVTA